MKKLVLFLIIILISLFSLSFAIETNCPNLILIDASNGRTIYEKNSHEHVAPASTTKVMTAILVLEKADDLNETTTASRNAISSVPAGGSTASIRVGESLKIVDLLKALLIASGNDAANILAEYVSDNISDFVTLMNEKAKELGCEDTHFANPTGLSQQDHYSCAYDLAIMYKYAFDKFESFRSIISMTEFNLPATDKFTRDTRVFKTTNQLLIPSEGSSSYYYEYCTGGKTGYTSGAKNCLVSSATKDDINLICVVLGGTQSAKNQSFRYTDTISLFNYGFDNLYTTTLVKKDDIVGSTRVSKADYDNSEIQAIASDSLTLTLDKSVKLTDIQKNIVYNDNLEAPIEKGEIIGKIEYKILDKKYEISLVSDKAVQEYVESFIPLTATVATKNSKSFFGFFIFCVLLILGLATYKIYSDKTLKEKRLFNMRRYNARFRR